MAIRVPTNPTARIQSRGVSSPGLRVNTTLDDFGGDGRGLLQLASGLDKVGAATDALFGDEVKKQSEMELLNAKRALNDFELSLQQDGGALTLRGEDALGSSGEVESLFDSTVEGLRFSENTRNQIETLIESRRRSVMGTVTGHERTERESLIQSQHAAGLESEIERYSLLPVDEMGKVMGSTTKDGKLVANQQAFENNITAHHEALAEREFGAKSSWTDETQAIVNERIETDVSKGVRMNIERLIGSGKPRRAEALFKDAQENGMLDEGDEAALEGVVEDATLAQDAQDWVDEHADLPFEKRVSEMREIEDEKLRSEVRTKMNQDEALNEAVRQQNERATEEGAYGRMRTQNAGALSAEERRVLGPNGVRLWEQTQSKVNSGLALEHKAPKWGEFTFLSTEELKTMSVADYNKNYGAHFDQSHYDAGLAAMKSARENTPVKYNGVNGLLSSTERVRKHARAAVGIPVETPSKDFTEEQTQRLTAFNDEVDRRLMAWSSENGGATPGQEIVERTVAEVQIDRVDLDTDYADGLNDLQDVPISTIPLDQFHMITVDDAKADELERVVGIANQNGRVLSKDQQSQAVAYMRIAVQAALNPRLSPAIVREARVQWQRLTGRVSDGE